MDVKKNQKEQWTELNKNECGVLKQMATYQLNAPLKVTLILEESDTEDHEMPIEDSVKTKDNNSKVTSEPIFGSQILHQAKYLNGQTITFTMDHNRMVQNTNQLVSNENNKVNEKALSIEQKKIRKLLDSLSKNIIRIIDLGYDTYNNYKNDRLMFEKAKNNYLQFKNNIFEKSYVITKSIILPEEKNYCFVEKFISRTLQIGNNMSYHRVPRELLLNIIMELINWTKQKVLKTSKTLTNVDHNSLTSTINMAPIITQQFNNINSMCSNLTTEENKHTTNDYPLNKIQGIINKLSIKRNASINIPEEENTIRASKRRKVTHNKCYNQNISQTTTQNYTIDNELWKNELVNNNNNLNIDHQSSALRSVSRDSGIGSPICTNWPSDQMITMEQQTFNNDDLVLERMKKIQFNRPVSVTLILEEPNVDDHHEPVGTLLNKQYQNSTNYVDNASKEPSAVYSLYAGCNNTENRQFRDFVFYMNNKLHCNINDSVHTKTSSLSNGANIKSNLDTSDKRKLIMLLDGISDNILLLANYTYLCNAYKNNAFKYKKAVAEFSRRRCDIYKSSYTTITGIIIPLENNNIFIQKFINRTVAIAHSKSWLYIGDKIVKEIVLDLIKWTKYQNQVWETNQRRSPEINTSLNNTSTNAKTTDANNVCIFSHGSPGEEITINIDSQVLKTFLCEQNSNISYATNTTKISNKAHQTSMDKSKSNQNEVMQEQSTSNNNKINSKRRRCQTLSNMSPYNPLPLNQFRTRSE